MWNSDSLKAFSSFIPVFIWNPMDARKKQSTRLLNNQFTQPVMIMMYKQTLLLLSAIAKLSFYILFVYSIAQAEILKWSSVASSVSLRQRLESIVIHRNRIRRLGGIFYLPGSFFSFVSETWIQPRVGWLFQAPRPAVVHDDHMGIALFPLMRLLTLLWVRS